MTRPSETRPPERRPPPPWLLWLAFLTTPALWMAYFLLAYVFTEATCGAAGRVSTEVGVPVGAVLAVATVIVSAISGAATVATNRVRRRTARTEPLYDDFLPRVGYVMGLLITYVLLAHLIPIAILGACA